MNTEELIFQLMDEIAAMQQQLRCLMAAMTTQNEQMAAMIARIASLEGQGDCLPAAVLLQNLRPKAVVYVGDAVQTGTAGDV